MPNSLVTFNRFYLTHGPTAHTNGQPDQVDAFNQFLTIPTGGPACAAGTVP